MKLGPNELYETDLKHLDEAISLLQKASKFTAAERVSKVRESVAQYLSWIKGGEQFH